MLELLVNSFESTCRSRLHGSSGIASDANRTHAVSRKLSRGSVSRVRNNNHAGGLLTGTCSSTVFMMLDTLSGRAIDYLASRRLCAGPSECRLPLFLL